MEHQHGSSQVELHPLGQLDLYGKVVSTIGLPVSTGMCSGGQNILTVTLMSSLPEKLLYETRNKILLKCKS